MKNRLELFNRLTQETSTTHVRRTSASQPSPRPFFSTKILSVETPVSRPTNIDFIPSAMKGIVLTSTGGSLATPSQAELNFAKIFDFKGGDHNGTPVRKPRDDEEADSPSPSPSSRKTKHKERRKE